MNDRVTINRNEVPSLVTVGLFETKKPWLHVDRVLPIDTMLYVMNGSVYLSEENEDYEITNHQVFFLKNGCRHWGKTFTKPGSRWYWVSFLPSVSDNAEEPLYLPKQLTVSSPERMFWILGTMHRLYASSEPLREERLNGLLYQLQYELLHQQASANMDMASSSVASKIIRLLQEQVNGSFHGESIANALNMNYSYLGRMFKSVTGVSILQYYKRLKVQRAIQLMESASLNISQISELLQFPNPYYFSRVFKQVTGFSPKDYQKLLYR
ncbi:helix-turn-helix transcriptional regulator [Paenibacillus ferrarius]|uniref:helix-turn-helix transcriptional regulator n=1 Tax=Paenibacillus ferrarius TaxID=1469647 RepID=UPI003D2AD705